MAENEEPLLKRVYYEGCPGCELDQWSDNNRGMPYRFFIHVWFITLCAALPISSLFPFLYFMMRDLHVAKRVEDIGFYAGFVGSSFMLGRALTSVFWGIIADRYGRKPVIVIGLIALVIFNTLFGLSTSYWMAIVTRFLLGSLNGLLGPIKAYAVEVAGTEYQAVGISLVSTAWGMGLVVGPSIGGLLAQPADKFPNLFSKDSLFGRFPYFLPCLFISLFSAVVLSTCPWLPETLHKHHQSKPATMIAEGLEGSFHGTEVKIDLEGLEESDGDSNENLFMNWPLMSSVIVYCVFSLHDMAYTEIFPLWAESGRAYGGLGLSSQDVGEVLAISGFSLLAFQLFAYPPMEKLVGHVNLCRVAALLALPLIAAYPFIAKLSGLELTIIVNCASLVKNVLSVSIITGLFILQNNAVEQHQRGAANGISMTGQSIFKAIAPAAAGAIFSWAQKHRNSSFLPGNHMVFFILNLVEFVGLVMTFKPFLAYSTQRRR
ncbi:protein ZINC INDUCED FACILITATOR-LIKE 1 isoform X1 [Dendrobium catenatum]|uniref:Protein ZINC INDUCED FACILITATOR-LIKE 1 n=1 Tax=Dendrobium catenatum TaxID=906689 RepID=A0A2I0W389_9ASPA|nr:protein ZINC INDUCED FACILITATOR-LIKE 1 isoform X1 [Dendrobium catenatum]PKU70126.1 Protein ZINC INDUCED FACILITATOR-LIKE 1 [Dendrobium catenatum]